MKNSMFASRLGLVVVVTAFGCAPIDNLVGEEQVTSVGGRNAGGEGVGGAKGDTTAVSFGGATSPGGSNSSCDAYQNVPSSHSVEVIVKNERNAPIYLESGNGGPCSWGESMTITDWAGRRLLQAANCTCNALMNEGRCAVPSCAYPALLRIEPGSSKTLTWDGTESVLTNLPKACTPSNATSIECELTRPAAGGTYNLVVNGSTDWKCEDDTECSCDAINGCRANSTMTRAGTLLSPTVTFDLYSTSSVTVVFGEIGYI
jgi:hypothetical protein